MWVNAGKEYTGGGIILNGKRYWKPTAAQFEAAGYKWEDPSPPFFAVKTAFWSYVDEAAAALTEATGQTYARADFPTGAYSPELLAWCEEHGMGEAETGALAMKFCGIAADLARLGRNWNELFDEVANGC